MSVLNSLLLTLSLLFVCESAYVDKLMKCSIKDSECLKKSYEQVKLMGVGRTGIPELGILPYDPMHIKNESITIVKGVTLTVTEGVIKGMADCAYKNFTVDLEKFTAFQEIICDVLNLKGDFVVSGKGKVVRQFVGTTEINGRGRARAKLEKVYMSYDIPFRPVKKDDGEIYMSVRTKGVHFKYDIGKATFATEKVFIDNFEDDLSGVATTVLNTNWKAMFNSVGSTVMDQAKDLYLELIKKYFDLIPTKTYIIEDLTPYIKNE